MFRRIQYLVCISTFLVGSWVRAENFKLEDGKLVIRIYSATWCGPCKTLAEGLMQSEVLAKGSVDGTLVGTHKVQINGREREITIEKFDLDVLSSSWLTEHEVASMNELEGVPTFAVFKGKKKLFVGLPRQLREFAGTGSAEDMTNRNLLNILSTIYSNDQKTPTKTQKTGAAK